MKSFAPFLFALALPLPAFSETPDPPGRVGRVAWTQGEVVLHSDPERGWEKAYVNSPLTSENSLWTEPAARAELRIGSTALRLEEATQLDMRRLDDELLRAHVLRGTVGLRIRHFEKDERYVVSTPNARFLILGNGRYRVDAEEGGERSRLTVFAGAAQLDTAGRRVSIGAGEAVHVQSDGAGFDFERAAATPFDEWSLARDERVIDGESSRYVSPRMTGYEDLDRYGAWTQDSEYGAVWYPNSVAGDYVPYRDGNWTYTQPWGWTWVDYAPWGYAPFHYGRWVYARNRWGWCPGEYVRRPVWAPALVGWVGRPGWSVTIGAGSAPVMGWYPLSPRDRYRPWYNNNPRYVDRVNGNWRERPGRGPRDDDATRVRGTTIVLRENFVNRRPVANSMAPVSGEVIAAQPVTSGVGVLPSRAEITLRKPLSVGAPAAAKPPTSGGMAVRGEPARGEAASRGQPVVRGEPAAPAAPSRPTTVKPNYNAPVAGAPVERNEPRAQTKPLRAAPVAAPSAPVNAPAAPVARSPVPRTIQERPPAAPVAAPAAPVVAPAAPAQVVREKPAPRESASEKPEKPDKPDKPERESAPAPVPMQKPMRVQQK